jgi:hypothetical protein
LRWFIVVYIVVTFIVEFIIGIRFTCVRFGGQLVIRSVVWARWGKVRAVVLVIVDNGIRVIFGDHRVGVNQGHPFLGGDGFDAGYGGVRDWDDGP